MCSLGLLCCTINYNLIDEKLQRSIYCAGPSPRATQYCARWCVTFLCERDKNEIILLYFVNNVGLCFECSNPVRFYVDKLTQQMDVKPLSDALALPIFKGPRFFKAQYIALWEVLAWTISPLGSCGGYIVEYTTDLYLTVTKHIPPPLSHMWRVTVDRRYAS